MTKKRFDPWDPELEDRYMCDWADISDAMAWSSITRLPRDFPEPAIVLFGVKKFWHLGDIRAYLQAMRSEGDSK